MVVAMLSSTNNSCYERMGWGKLSVFVHFSSSSNNKISTNIYTKSLFYHFVLGYKCSINLGLSQVTVGGSVLPLT